MIEEYAKEARAKKIEEYLKFYPKTVERMVKDAGLI
jgi:Mn-dependent DtxR family transcriptional regulator